MLPLPRRNTLSSFQSTPSGGKATRLHAQYTTRAPFQSTPSGGKATRRRATGGAHSRFQSTPSGGKATHLWEPSVRSEVVSIHAFRGEGDAPARACRSVAVLFQSTPSGGKATGTGIVGSVVVRSFNPRLPGGRRLNTLETGIAHPVFQSTPSGGKATGRKKRRAARWKFQSTPSGGKATDDLADTTTNVAVSIHAFRGEGDRIRREMCVPAHSFNPRLPGGRRLETPVPTDGE